MEKLTITEETLRMLNAASVFADSLYQSAAVNDGINITSSDGGKTIMTIEEAREIQKALDEVYYSIGTICKRLRYSEEAVTN